MKQTICAVMAVIGILAFFSTADAASKIFKVQLLVVPTDETALVSQTKSYIGRELRALGDIELVNSDPNSKHYFISIYPISVRASRKGSSEEIIGVAVSYVFEKDSSIVHSVIVGAQNDLKEICSRIVAYFDTHMLDPERSKGR